MIKGMTTTKIAVSLPEELVLHARSAVKSGTARSVSSYIAGALEEKKKLEDLTGLIDEMLAETGGPLTEDEIRSLDREARR